MSAINEFPWEETILRELRDGTSATVDEVARSAGSNVDVEEVRSKVEHDVRHLIEIGLVSREGGHLALTPDGAQAAGRLL